MADKIIDFDPSRRITKDALDIIRSKLNELTVDEIQSLVIVSVQYNAPPAVHAFGLDFHTLGVAQAVLAALGQDMLSEEFEPVEE